MRCRLLVPYQYHPRRFDAVQRVENRYDLTAGITEQDFNALVLQCVNQNLSTRFFQIDLHPHIYAENFGKIPPFQAKNQGIIACGAHCRANSTNKKGPFLFGKRALNIQHVFRSKFRFPPSGYNNTRQQQFYRYSNKGNFQRFSIHTTLIYLFTRDKSSSFFPQGGPQPGFQGLLNQTIYYCY